MNRIKFSIVIPVYNAERYVKRCLNSLISQTYNDIEILAIDDGSTDRSLLILKDFEKIESRLRVFSQENSGPSAARNLGLENAIGQYVSFVDADDWLELNAFESLESKIKKNDFPDLVMFNTFTNDNKRNKPFLTNGLYNEDKIVEYIFPRTIESLDKSKGSAIRASVWLRVFKRSLLDGIKFNKILSNNEDLVFCFQAILKVKTFLYLGDSYLYHNCMTEGSLSRGYMKNAFERMLPLFEILSQLSKDSNSFNFSYQIKARVFRTIIYCFENEFRKGNDKNIFQKYSYIKQIMNNKEIECYLSGLEPGKEKSKILYHFFYKNRMVLATILLANYKSRKQSKRVSYV